MLNKTERDPLTEKIIGCCFKVHNALGPGLAEKVYHKALIIAIKEANLKYETEKSFSIFFNSNKVGLNRLDLVIGNRVIVEIKAVSGYMPKLFHSQLISYLKLSGLPIGLLINFGNERCQIKRFIHTSV